MPSPRDYQTRPTLSDIIRKVQPMPTLARQDFVQAEYIGKPVHWTARFFELSDETGFTGNYHLSWTQRGLRLSDTGLIYTPVAPGQFPELERLVRGTRADLYGTIQEVDELLGVTLILEAAEVLPRSLMDRWITFSERRY